MNAHAPISDRCGRSIDRRTGTAALEFVIVLPVLIVIVVGAADLSRALYLGNVLSNAARVGATYGATHQVTNYIREGWESRVIERTNEEAAHIPDFDAAALDVTVTTSAEADGSTRVQVAVRYPFVLLIHWPGWPDRLTLDRRVSMRSYR